MTFRELAIGQHFRFFERGALLHKVSHRTYDNPAFDQRGMVTHDLDQPVILVEMPT